MDFWRNLTSINTTFTDEVSNYAPAVNVDFIRRYVIIIVERSAGMYVILAVESSQDLKVLSISSTFTAEV